MKKKSDKQRILVVDDSTENIDILVSLFRDECMVAAARTGEKALKMAEKNPPDLILLDIIMPEMDGYEVCRRLKKIDVTRNIPVIFITALSEAIDEARAFGTGAVDFISKPFQPIVVKARVRTHLNLKMKTDMLESLAAVDGLTNIFNRRRFDEKVEQEWRRAVRGGKSLSLIMLDVDEFKLINDRYGHAQGDECLRKIAGAVKNELQRAGDFLSRYGGEEFAVIVADADEESAVQLAEKMRQAVAGLEMVHEYAETAPYVTISAGVATFRSPSAEESASLLINAADRMLYEAKSRGRNQVKSMVL